MNACDKWTVNSKNNHRVAMPTGNKGLKAAGNKGLQTHTRKPKVNILHALTNIIELRVVCVEELLLCLMRLHFAHWVLG